MLVMLGSLKLLQLLEVSKWDGSGELSDDCGDACQLDNELLLGDVFVWRQTNFSDCSVTCGIGKASNIENSLSSLWQLTITAFVAVKSFGRDFNKRNKTAYH